MSDQSNQTHKNSDLDKNLIPGHEYDGIRELDNPLPGWWLITFYGTIIFAFLYWIHYTFSGAPDSVAELKMALAEIQASATNHMTNSDSNLTIPKEEELMALAKQVETVKMGRDLFAGKCASCHGPQGAGLVGPNLTDKYWIHGKGSGSDIYQVVSTGVLDKGMPAWKDTLKPDELKSAVAFVLSIKNTNVPGGKAPQGTETK